MHKMTPKRILILQKRQMLLSVNDEKCKIMPKYFQGGNYNEIKKMEKFIGKMRKCVGLSRSVYDC